MLSKFITVQTPNSQKIHYVEIIDGKPDVITECGLSGPFEKVVIHYRDRYNNNVCKKCFKNYIAAFNE